MSGTGSPTDRTGNDNANPQEGAPAGTPTEGGVAPSGSGDANSQPPAPSADGNQGANKDPKKPSFADVIKTAADVPDAGSGTSPAPANDGKDKVAGEADPNAPKADGEKAETDDSKLPFHNHPRWKEVIGQNRELADKVKDLEPAAEQFGKIETFMQEHKLSHDEVGELFIVGAMAKAGDARVLQKIDEFRDKVALAIGEKLPTDIQEQVESGAITEAAGKELAKSRVQASRSKAEADELRAQDDQQKRENDAVAMARDFQAGVTAWEAAQRKIDPDFAKKEKAVARYAQAFMRERGMPKTKEEAVQYVKDAYDEVNKDFAAAIPQKKPVDHVPSAPSNPGATPKPTSLSDAVRQAAAKG